MPDPVSQPDRDSGIARLVRRHPAWEVWRGTSGRCYARRAEDHSAMVQGADLVELRDHIILAERLRQAP